MAYGPTSLGGSLGAAPQTAGTGTTKPSSMTSFMAGPWGLPAILGGSALLGGLGSMFGQAPNWGPSYNFMLKHFGPQQLGFDTEQLYTQMLANPMFQNQLNMLNVQGMQAQRNLAAGLGQRGMETSGVGTVMKAMAPSALMLGRQQAYGNLWEQAQKMAAENLMARLQALPGYGAQPGFGDYFNRYLMGGLMGWGQLQGLQNKG